ncbi:MAG: isoleucine--tRNA ligase [Bacilli bacterium]|nr:isoleucine--tRNA ligase [Bacilli bacterium]MDD4053939.1 isoleucine--tRNA ligase [Bacilli bacterium]MDD4411199.1 isoleucine--tRNA ligase [Bacilli bacterium]
MAKFKELSEEKTSVVESNISKKWEEINILEKCINNRDKNENFVFYDGPATANGMPGLHHMLAKLLKDAFCKYKTMQGYRVVRKAGWDTHGLPVEIEVEKELGFTSKTDIDKFGIKEFNKKCKQSVFRNEDAFREYTKKMGQFIDLDNAYVTYDNDYIETEWWILNKMFNEGLIYEGHKILPFCTRCGTGLATHEVAQGYKEITTDTVIVPMKLKDEDAYFLVWTTTPWTLLANVALCVNPNEKYIKVESKGYKFILAASLANKVLGDEYTIIKEYLGKDLEHIEYEQLLPFLKVNKKAFYVTLADFVTMEDGTGIVHMAPAFGADDYEVGRKYGLPVLNPVDEDGKYTDGPWTGTYVMDANLDIIKYLKENDKLFKKQKMEHNYPHCWRCKTPLLYYAKPSWYIEVTKYKDTMINENNKVNWFPEYVGEKRFGNWLENLNDWAISRTRYWGTPLNLWKCECGHVESVGSRAELVSKAIEDIDESIELHRPYVDNVHIKCSDCGKVMSRVPEVIDVWFDSGSMPFAQYHYPFENKELFEAQFPADFICEGIDQTRGWFYSLLAVSSFVMGKSPFKNVLVNDMLLDKYGQKMSKSKGNGLNPFELIEEYGADTLRWYLPYVSPVWTPTRFDIDGLKEVHSKFFNTLKNTYNFFTLYANTDDVDPRTFNIPYQDREEIDKWLLSKYNKLIDSVTAGYEQYDLTKVVRDISDFVNEDLSNWYIRRNRRRFWGSRLDDSKKAVYNTTYEVLEGLSRLIAPIVPFISEEMYKNLTNEESVHLADFPKCDERLINEDIEEKMDLVRELISLGRAGREEAKIKVRQPISDVLIDAKHETMIGDLIDLIIEELNVKQVTFTPDLHLYMDFIVLPNFKISGPIFGSNIKLFSEALSNISSAQIAAFSNNKSIKLEVASKVEEITPDMVEIRINSKEGFNINMQNNHFVILNTTLNQDLIDEGMARELISKIQQMRKNNDFDVIDRIKIYYNGNDDIKRAIEKYNEFIKKETLAEEIIFQDNINEKFNLNGFDVFLDVIKIK